MYVNLWLTGEFGSECRRVDELQDQKLSIPIEITRQVISCSDKLQFSQQPFDLWLSTSDHTLNDYFVTQGRNASVDVWNDFPLL